MDFRIVRIATNDPYTALAFEERIFDTLPAGTDALLLWTDGPCVVFGKHQNPWKECDLRFMADAGIPPVRRITGGGTVYHDLGNLNYSVVTERDRYSRGEILETVASSLRTLGIDCGIRDGLDITVGERKISGSAFCFRRNRVLHHGTVLVDVDTVALRRCLRGTGYAISGHAVASRRSPTVNLSEVLPGIGVGDVMEAMEGRFLLRAGHPVSEVTVEPPAADPGVAAIAGRNRSWEWIYGRTPAFSVAADGGLSSEVRGGTIDRITRSDGTDHPAAAALSGSRFSCSVVDNLTASPDY